MPDNQTVVRKARGLVLHPNQAMLPEGALTRAENCVIVRDNVIEKRRGFSRYGDILIASPSVLLEYQDRLLVRDETRLKYDSDGLGTWVAYAPQFADPDSQTRAQFLRANKNLYFTDTSGIYSLDTLTGTPLRSGIEAGLDSYLTLTGIGGSWFTPGTQVGYRITFGRLDANQNLKIGTPSPAVYLLNPITDVTWASAGAGPYTITVTQVAHGYSTGDVVVIQESSEPSIEGAFTITVTGPDTYTYSVTLAAPPAATGTAKTGKKFDVSINFSLPQEVFEGDFYEIWRTEMSAAPDALPDPRFFHVIKNTVTAGDVAAKNITFIDTFDQALLDEDLYTNDTQDTERLTNDRPPFSIVMEQFKGHIFLGQIIDKEELQLQLLMVDGITDGVDSISITSPSHTRTYTFDTTENVATGHFRRFTFPTADAPTLADAIRLTAQSLIRVVNRDNGQLDIYALYDSGQDEAPGKIKFRARVPNVVIFWINANASSTGAVFSPELPTSGNSVISMGSTFLNGLRVGKFEEPEAFPISRTLKIGRADRKILWLKAVTDALLIGKEEGVYKLTGETDRLAGDQFVVTALDPTVNSIGPNTAVVLDNAVFTMTTQGLVRITSAGVTIVSRAIELDLLLSVTSTIFAANAFAASYESERSYILACPEKQGDTQNTILYVYNYLTNTWVKWRKKIRCLRVLETPDRLYMGHYVDFFVLKERKERTTLFRDIVDEEFSTTISNITTAIDEFGLTVTQADVTWNYSGAVLQEGFILAQPNLASSRYGKIVSLISNSPTSFTVVLDRRLSSLTDGAGTIALGIDLQVEWIELAGSAATMKLIGMLQIYQEDEFAIHNEIGVFSNFMGGPEVAKFRSTPRGRGWGSEPWGSSAWGSGRKGYSPPIRIPVHENHQRCAVFRYSYRNRYAYEQSSISQTSLDLRVYSSRTGRRPQ